MTRADPSGPDESLPEISTAPGSSPDVDEHEQASDRAASIPA